MSRLTDLPFLCVQKLRVPPSSEIHLHEFYFSDFSLDEDQTLVAAIRMFMDLDLINRFRINYEVNCRRLLKMSQIFQKYLNFSTIFGLIMRNAFK